MQIDRIESGRFAAAPDISASPNEFQLVSWNIARGAKLDAILEFLNFVDADLILLQESDLNTRRSAYRNIAKELAPALGMNYVFGIEFQELGQGSRTSPAYQGQATLSRWPLSEPRILRFRRQSNFWRPRWWIPPFAPFQRRSGGRMALITRVAIGDRSLIVYNVHLESRDGENLRLAQVSELLDDASQYGPDTQLLIAGDFNFDLRIDSQKTEVQRAQFENPFAEIGVSTISSSAHRRQPIDWILVRGESKGRSPRVHDSVRASDHFPLSLTLQMR
jgi:endonuclease/exonuclease/phosphatase family metal-dependent hydrolase